MKKIFGYIMAFMVLSFSMLPCADDLPISKEEVKSELTQSIPQDNDGDHKDACSPFCICSCCAGFSVLNKLPSTQAILPNFQTEHSSYITDRLFSIALPIWQPPRLV